MPSFRVLQILCPFASIICVERKAKIPNLNVHLDACEEKAVCEEKSMGPIVGLQQNFVEVLRLGGSTRVYRMVPHECKGGG